MVLSVAILFSICRLTTNLLSTVGNVNPANTDLYSKPCKAYSLLADLPISMAISVASKNACFTYSNRIWSHQVEVLLYGSTPAHTFFEKVL